MPEAGGWLAGQFKLATDGEVDSFEFFAKALLVESSVVETLFVVFDTVGVVSEVVKTI